MCTLAGKDPATGEPGISGPMSTTLPVGNALGQPIERAQIQTVVEGAGVEEPRTR